MLFAEFGDLVAAHHGAIIIGQFADHADRRQPCELAQINRGLRVARTHQHAAIFRNQREDVAGADEIIRAHIAIGERADRVGALLGRNAGGEAVFNVNRYRESGAKRGIVRGDHRVEVQPLSFRRGERRTNNAAAITDDEGHLFRRAMRGRDDEIAFVFTIIIIGDNHERALGEGFNRFRNRMVHDSPH